MTRVADTGDTMTGGLTLSFAGDPTIQLDKRSGTTANVNQIVGSMNGTARWFMRLGDAAMALESISTSGRQPEHQQELQEGQPHGRANQGRRRVMKPAPSGGASRGDAPEARGKTAPV